MLSSERYLYFGFDGVNIIDDVSFITNVLVQLEEVIQFGLLESGAVVDPYDDMPITWVCERKYL